MFDRFSEKIKKIFQIAREEAKKKNAKNLDRDHIMAALLIEDKSAIEGLLEQTNAPASQFIESFLEKFQKKTRRTSLFKGEVTFSEDAKRTIGAAFKEASFLNDDYVEVEHLLMALLQEKTGILGELIEHYNISYRKLRAVIYQERMLKTKIEQRAKTEKKSALEVFCRDLTQLARDGKLDPVIGREDELERVMQILNRRTKNNPVLLGEAGVGKTAIVEGLAQAIIRGNVPLSMSGKRIVSLDLAALVAGTKCRGQFEERLQQLLRELISTKDVTLFIDEVHTLVGAGAAEGSFDAANMMKPALSRGEFQCIGATTIAEFRKHIEKDGALERRFQTVYVSEPSVNDTISILQGLRLRYEDFHGVTIADEALRVASRLSDHYITDRFLPDKAIDVLDEACARVKLRNIYQKTDESKQSLYNHAQERGLLVGRDYGAAQSLPLHEEPDLPNQKKETSLVTISPPEITVSDDDVAEIVSLWSGVPVTRLRVSDAEILTNMEDNLHRRVVGQDPAISVISRAIRRSRAGLQRRNRPVGSFLFMGPSGVGKTELARTLSEFLFGDENSLVRVDMSEYMEKHSSSRLIGSPPGYIGYEEGGQLTEKVRRRPYSVVLLDEIEKADQSIFNLLLQVLDEGHLTDGLGRTVNFKNTVLIMTSNLGSRHISSGKDVGFATHQPERLFQNLERKLLEETRTVFSPEFLNRIDEIVVFHQLEETHLDQIFDLQLRRFHEQDRSLQITLTVQDQAKRWLVNKALDEHAGARPLLRFFRIYIEDPLAEKIISGEFPENAEVQLLLREGKPVLKLKVPSIPDSFNEFMNS